MPTVSFPPGCTGSWPCPGSAWSPAPACTVQSLIRHAHSKIPPENWQSHPSKRLCEHWRSLPLMHLLSALHLGLGGQTLIIGTIQDARITSTNKAAYCYSFSLCQMSTHCGVCSAGLVSEEQHRPRQPRKPWQALVRASVLYPDTQTGPRLVFGRILQGDNHFKRSLPRA